MTNQIVILAAGKGTRMGGNIPKVLVMLKNKPLILYILEQIEKITQLINPVIVVGFKAQSVKAVLGDGYTYAWQKEQLGTAHALECAKKYIKAKNILALYGDMPFISAESLRSLIKLHHNKEARLSMLTLKVSNFEGIHKTMSRFARIIRNTNKQIVKIVEYKDASAGQKKILELNPGIYMFNTKWLWENIKKIKNNNAQGEYYLTEIAQIAIEAKEKIYSLSIPPKEGIGVNNKADLELAEQAI